jgi:hypothetical protein
MARAEIPVSPKIEAAGKQPQQDLSERPVGLAGRQRNAAGWRLRAMARLQQNRRGARFCKFGDIARIIEKGEIPGTGAIDRRDAANYQGEVGVVIGLSARPVDDGADGRRQRRWKEIGFRHEKSGHSSRTFSSARRPSRPQKCCKPSRRVVFPPKRGRLRKKKARR